MRSSRSQLIEILDKLWVSSRLRKSSADTVKVMSFTNLYTKRDTCVFPNPIK